MKGSLLVRRSLSVVVVFTALLAAEGEIRNTVVAQDQKDRPAVLVNPMAIGHGVPAAVACAERRSASQRESSTQPADVKVEGS